MQVVLIEGDGIGPEVTGAARRVVAAAGVKIDWVKAPAGLLAAEQLADGESEAVIARRRAERERDADHDELLTLRAEKAALHREIELLREDVAHLPIMAMPLRCSWCWTTGGVRPPRRGCGR